MMVRKAGPRLLGHASWLPLTAGRVLANLGLMFLTLSVLSCANLLVKNFMNNTCRAGKSWNSLNFLPINIPLE